MKKFIALALASVALAGCTRVETGEVGVRIGMDKQVQRVELQPGSWNQTMFGDVLTFPVKDVEVDVADMHPLASDNSTLKDFDLSVIYSINPGSVAELYINKNRGFHASNDEGDTFLMYNYVHQLARNAVYKTARQYEALKMNDSRSNIEQQIRAEIVENLRAEGLGDAIRVSQVLVRQIMPADNIVTSANALVEAQNEERRKQVEVRTARLEAERISALNANAGATRYMAAQAMLNISEGVRDGKVNTIVVPSDFRGMVNVPSN